MLFPSPGLISPNYQRVSKHPDMTDLLSESCGHDWKALPAYYDRSVMVMEGKVCTVAIAPQERIAYYPPLRGGSNGEGEGILSVMVMMHFKWIAPIIYQWTIMAGGSILWVTVVMPGKWRKGPRRISRV